MYKCVRCQTQIGDDGLLEPSKLCQRCKTSDADYDREWFDYADFVGSPQYRPYDGPMGIFEDLYGESPAGSCQHWPEACECDQGAPIEP